MSRLALFTLVLQLPFCVHGMINSDDEPSKDDSLSIQIKPLNSTSFNASSSLSQSSKNSANPTLNPFNTTIQTNDAATHSSALSHSASEDIEDEFPLALGASASQTSSNSAYCYHVDISHMGSLAALLGISERSNDRTLFGGLLRWGAKHAGYMQPDLAGIGTAAERECTVRILRRYEEILLSGEEFDSELHRQFLERQAAAATLATTLLKELQSLNNHQMIADPLLKIRAAQQLLTIHEKTTLPPKITDALKTAIKIARITTRAQLESKTETDS